MVEERKIRRETGVEDRERERERERERDRGERKIKRKHEWEKEGRRQGWGERERERERETGIGEKKISHRNINTTTVHIPYSTYHVKTNPSQMTTLERDRDWRKKD